MYNYKKTSFVGLLCQSVHRQFVAIYMYMYIYVYTSYTCRIFLHFGKCRKIFTKVVPHCSISTLTLKAYLHENMVIFKYNYACIYNDRQKSD